ncbi:hypothetical protein D9M70_510360 [compost metagenome]
MLGGAVGRQLGRATQAGHRGDVQDDPAALREHLTDLVLHAEEHALGVDREAEVQLVFAGVDEGPHRRKDAGVVDADIEAPEGVDRRIDQRLDLGLAGHVARLGDHAGTGLAQLRSHPRQALRIAVAEGEPGPHAGQTPGQQLAEAAGRAGDHHHLVLVTPGIHARSP